MPKRKNHEQKKKDPYTLPSGGIKPCANDVLLGKRRAAFWHEGNRRLRVMVASKVEEYKQARRKQQGQIIVASVEDIYGKHGRFLRYDDGAWVDAGFKAGRNKVGHAFRDAVLSNKGECKCVRDLMPRKKERGRPHTQQMPSLADVFSHAELDGGSASDLFLDSISMLDDLDLDDVVNTIDPLMSDDDVVFVELASPFLTPRSAELERRSFETTMLASSCPSAEPLASSMIDKSEEAISCPPDSRNIDTLSRTNEEEAELFWEDIVASMPLASYSEIGLQQEQLLSSSYMIW